MTEARRDRKPDDRLPDQLLPDPDPDAPWWHRARCVEYPDPEIWFSTAPAMAKQICSTCPVRRPCLLDALKTVDATIGVRGGLSARQRHGLSVVGGRVVRRSG